MRSITDHFGQLNPLIPNPTSIRKMVIPNPLVAYVILIIYFAYIYCINTRRFEPLRIESWTNEPLASNRSFSLEEMFGTEGGNGSSREDAIQIPSSPSGSDHESFDCDELPQNRETNKSLACKLSGERMQIHVQELTGHQIPVKIAISDTISDIKQKIFDKKGIYPYDQRFIFGRWELSEGAVLDQINAILARQPQLSDSSERRWWYYCDDLTGTVHATIMMILLLKGERNTICHRAQKTHSSTSRSDSNCLDEQHLGDGKIEKNSGWSGYCRFK